MNLTEQIQTLINDGALFVINDSAGKDSQAMKILLHRTVPREQLVVVHANLPGVDWPGNMEHIRNNSFGLPVHEVTAAKTFFEMVERRKMFPSSKHRQCTSDLKRDPIQKFINQYSRQHGFSAVVNCLGLRAQESAARAKKPVFKVSERYTTAARKQFDWLPIHELTLHEVLQVITDAGQQPHPIYSKGMTRLSCCFCIMASEHDLRTAATINPGLAQEYIALEQRTGHTMFTKKSLAEILKQKPI